MNRLRQAEAETRTNNFLERRVFSAGGRKLAAREYQRDTEKMRRDLARAIRRLRRDSIG